MFALRARRRSEFSDVTRCGVARRFRLAKTSAARALASLHACPPVRAKRQTRAPFLTVTLRDPVDYYRQDHNGDARLHALADIERLDACQHVFAQATRADHRR